MQSLRLQASSTQLVSSSKPRYSFSRIDQCLYLRYDCIMVVYTDDCLIFTREDSIIDDLIQNLSNIFMLDDQGNVSDFLGIRMTSHPDTKTIHMVKPGLIYSIIHNVSYLLPAIPNSHQPIASFIMTHLAYLDKSHGIIIQ
jgi:hypothetical protein